MIIVDRIINIYCDESCHLKKDLSDIMVLGALSCPKNKREQVYEEIRKIKSNNGINSKAEAKWTKISTSKLKLFEDFIDYFFNNEDLTFRAVVAKNKQQLDHTIFNQNDYDMWYYKMYYLLLDKICDPNNIYKIYIDIKDTRGGPRVRKLHEVLCNNRYDFKRDIIKDIQQINSDRADLLQITDLLTGALSFYHRGLHNNIKCSSSKKIIVDKLISYMGNNINIGTSISEQKLNLFIWTPRQVTT